MLSLTAFGLSFLAHESAPMVAFMQLLVPSSLRGTAAGLEICLNSALSALVDLGIGATDDTFHNIRLELATALVVILTASVVGYEVTWKMSRKGRGGEPALGDASAKGGSAQGAEHAAVV